MDIGRFILTNGLNGLLAMGLLLVGYIVFNIITPDWNFAEVFSEKGVSGGAIIVAAFLLGLSIVISSAAY